MSRFLLLACVLLVAIGLRFWQIDSLPPGFHFDESFEGLEAWRILTDASYRPVFLTGNFGVPPLNAYANSITFGLFRLFGSEAGPTAMRATAAFFGVLGVVAVYGLASELGMLDRRRITVAFPFLAAAVLATLRWHIHFSRMGIEPILVPLVWAAALWLFLRGWRTCAWGWFAGCGVVLATGMYAYQVAWIIPLLMVPVFVHLWWDTRQLAATPGTSQSEAVGACRRQRLVGTAVAVVVAFLLVLPLGWFFVQNPALLLLRPTQIAVAGGGAAVQHGNVVQNLQATALMFVPVGQTGDLDPRRNLPGEPALNWWQFLPFLIGLGIALWRVRRPAYSILLIGLVGLLLPGVFSEYAPHFHRILGAAAPAALLCGLGLDTLVSFAQKRSVSAGLAKNWGVWVSVILVVAGGVTAARDYFVRWAALPDLFYAFDVGLWEVGQQIARQPAGENIYLTPRNADHPTLAFAWATQPGSHGAAVSFDGRQIFPVVEGSNPRPETYFVIEPEDFRTRLLLPEVLPEASASPAVVDRAGQVYATQYVRPAGETPARPPQYPVNKAVGDGIVLAGYDAQPKAVHPGEILYVQYHWKVDTVPTQDWTVFTHLLATDANGNWTQVAGQDSRPGDGSLPTNLWQPGWRVFDEHQLQLPADLPPGRYRLETGLYNAAGEQLPGGAAIPLGEVAIG